MKSVCADRLLVEVELASLHTLDKRVPLLMRVLESGAVAVFGVAHRNYILADGNGNAWRLMFRHAER